MEVMPAIDLRAGRAVRLVQGDFARGRDYGDPAVLAEHYMESGARWLHVVDLDAAATGRPVNRPAVLGILRAASVPVQVGGGLRNEEDVAALLEAGAARVVIATAALEAPEAAAELARRHPGRVAVALDYRRGAGTLQLSGRGWLAGPTRSMTEVLDELGELPLGAVVVTAIERDGTLTGPDTEGLGEVLDATDLPVVASGGVGSRDDLLDVAELHSRRHGRGVVGVIVGRALLDGRLSVKEAVATCARSG